AWVGRVVADPYRDRGAPVPVAGDGPVAGALEPFAELPVLDVVRHPGDLLVQFHHAVAELAHRDEPGGDALVDQGVLASPAVRVGVVVGFVPQQHGARGHGRLSTCGLPAGGGLEVGDDRGVRIEDELAGIVGDRFGERTVIAHRHHRLDLFAVGDHLVVLTEGAGG